ncbi:hypothetical protein [Chryseobacterium taihuense]|uniref:YD repeat-containing protein n=1 Tax=Chryseobacterium taihuense TaxID=1141221 RepID=A0ABY0QZH0_9FLAO|nr:hypothetical protein [Chryseobacterium taihuense]SDM14801.1 hypothetical protein SAMN05216273_114103 [Chryseobacterium taihuense]
MNIKKRILAFALFAITNISYNAQDINFGDFPRPVPTVSSLATYANVPISYASGIPDISIPLLNLPTRNKNINLDLSLSYNPLNAAPGEAASDVGRGWSLFMGGVISRKIIGELDEMYNDSSFSYYKKNEFDDIYYYNLPGLSGKFKIVRNITANTFQVLNTSSNLVKIEFTRTNNTATLIVDSFTITDTKGIKYIFNDFSLSNTQQNSHLLDGRIYRSAFFLSQIKDANNMEIANFSYQKDIRYKYISPSTINYQTCKLKNITSPSYGKIELDYVYNSLLENSMNDPYSVSKAVLKDNYNHIISQYGFEYLSSSTRILTKLKKINKNNVVSENTEFQYNTSEYDQFVTDFNLPYGYNLSYFCPVNDFTSNPRYAGIGILKRIINPTGGVTEYNFEPQEIYMDKTTTEYLNPIVNGSSFVNSQLQYLKEFNQFSFDTNNRTSRTFIVTGTPNVKKKVYIVFNVTSTYTPIFWDSNTPTYVDFNIKQGNQTIFTNGICANPGNSSSYKMEEYDLDPGTYEIRFLGSGGTGNVMMLDIGHLPLPFKNSEITNGVRIASIKYYKSTTDTAPESVTRYEYQNFTDSNSSSGYNFSPEFNIGDMDFSDFTLYRNVKVTNSDDHIGYTKYYYKNPNDYPSYPTVGSSSIWPYFNLTKSGLLEKKETYNSQHQIIASEDTEYIMEDINGVSSHTLYGGNVFSTAAYFKKITGITKSYLDNKIVEQKVETDFSPVNLEASVIKKYYDDSVTETTLTYPSATGGDYISLGTKNILSIPVIQEVKDNGKVISKSITQFAHPSSILPTSVLTTNISDGSTKTAVTFDLYDEKGNLLQMTSSVGIPTAIVYGYDKTQPIAKIQGATYAQVSPYIQAIVSASDADAANPANEQTLIMALDSFRKNAALKDFSISTMTYDPLIGMTTNTPPTGIREIFIYNADNKLEKVIDMNGNVITEHKYNYKN